MSIDRAPKPCAHKRANHQHGTYACYTHDGCRCLPCCNAASVYEQDRKKRNAYGRSNLVDAAPARKHVRQLMADGVGLKRIVVVAPISQGALWKLVYGKRQADGTQLRSERITRATAERLLALHPGDPALLADGARIDSTGTRRRLQALGCLGWRSDRLAAESGVDRQPLDQAMRGGQIVAAHARAVAAAYERLWDQPAPAADHRERISVSRSLNRAGREGWAPPAAWDDDWIDSPDAQPFTDVDEEDQVDAHAVELVLDGQPMQLTGRDLEVAVQRLNDARLSYADIAARVRSDEKTVRRVLNTARARMKREAARDGEAA